MFSRAKIKIISWTPTVSLITPHWNFNYLRPRVGRRLTDWWTVHGLLFHRVVLDRITSIMCWNALSWNVACVHWIHLWTEENMMECETYWHNAALILINFNLVVLQPFNSGHLWPWLWRCCFGEISIHCKRDGCVPTTEHQAIGGDELKSWCNYLGWISSKPTPEFSCNWCNYLEGISSKPIPEFKSWINNTVPNVEQINIGLRISLLGREWSTG